jgi:hypothetical protein
MVLVMKMVWDSKRQLIIGIALKDMPVTNVSRYTNKSES